MVDEGHDGIDNYQKQVAVWGDGAGRFKTPDESMAAASMYNFLMLHSTMPPKQLPGSAKKEEEERKCRETERYGLGREARRN